MTRRRGRGEGSVYRRKDGRCIGEYEDANGKRRYVSGTMKAEVRQKLRKLLADRDEGIAYDSENLTVGAYLDRWLEAVKYYYVTPNIPTTETIQRHLESVEKLVTEAEQRFGTSTLLGRWEE